MDMHNLNSSYGQAKDSSWNRSISNTWLTWLVSFSQEWSLRSSSPCNLRASASWPTRWRWFCISSISLLTWSTPGPYPGPAPLLPSDGNFEEVLFIRSIREDASEIAESATCHSCVMWSPLSSGEWAGSVGAISCWSSSEVTLHNPLHCTYRE